MRAFLRRMHMPAVPSASIHQDGRTGNVYGQLLIDQLIIVQMRAAPMPIGSVIVIIYTGSCMHHVDKVSPHG